MKIIGGFYESLLPEESFEYHSKAVALSNGRACIRLMLQNLNIKKCYVPNYTCDAVYHPFDLENVNYELYTIDECMEPVEQFELREGEYFYYINYFGVKGRTVRRLQEIYGDKLIIDNTHDFFKKRQSNNWSFTSARKYFGVPDGAFLYAPIALREENIQRFKAISLRHGIEKLNGDQSEAFNHYQEYEKSLTSDIKRISLYSEKMLSLVDMQNVMLKRRENFLILHSLLKATNILTIDDMAEEDVPFAYPFMPGRLLPKSVFYRDSIFIPSLWTDPLKRSGTTDSEKLFAKNLMPLPIDERYGREDMENMAKKIIGALQYA